MSEDADVKIKLTVDSGGTQEAINGLKENLQDVSESAKKANEGGAGFGRELLKANLYADLLKGSAHLVFEGMQQSYEMAEKLGDAAMETADEMNQQVRAMSGLMSFMDQGQHSMENIRDYAKDLREDLAQAGTQAGVSTQTMTAMFDSVIERGNRSTKAAAELTEQMALVGKVVPGGMEGLAQGFNMLELGMIRARNPLVQLIASTHVLKGNAYEIAQAMMKMTPEKQIELATRAIELQSKSLQKGGGLGLPTLQELKSSFGNIREGFLEAVGQPMLEKIIPPLVKVRDYLSEHSEQIAEYGEEIGSKIGSFVSGVENMLGELYQGAEQDWPKIKREFAAISQDWKDTWTEVLGKGIDLHADMKSMALEVAEGFHTASNYLVATVEVFKNFRDVINDEQGLLHAIQHYGEGTAKGRAQAAQNEVMDKAQLGATDQAGFDEAMAKYAAWAHQAGAADKDIDAFVDQQRAFHDAELRDFEQFKQRADSLDVEAVGKQLNQALSAGDQAFEIAALRQIASSGALTKALMDGTIQIAGGFDALKDSILDKVPELQKAMDKLKPGAIGAEGIKGHGPSVNFFGAITIKQDFRDQDPDRIMTVFRKDLVKQTINRRQSKFAMPFGL